MAFKKRELIADAFAEIGIASYEFDIAPDEQIQALRRLDGMMAQWNSVGIRIGYALPSADNASDPDQDSGITDEALEAVRTNLAMRIAPRIGKTVSVDTRATAMSAYRALLSRVSVIEEMQTGSMLPRGAGQKPWRGSDPFVPSVVDSLDVGPDGELTLE